MILQNGPSRPGKNGERFIGYWTGKHVTVPGLPDPKKFVDEAWDPDERRAVGEYLKIGSEFASWMGFSNCRICNKRNGTRCLTDGTFVWPEGFAHYVEEHAVRPPQEFVDHVLNIPPELLAELDRHAATNKALNDEFKARQDGEDCPDKGTVCHAERSSMCVIKKRNSSRASYYCQRMADEIYERKREEEWRHKEALAGLIKANAT
jgi:hypothetical protein